MESKTLIKLAIASLKQEIEYEGSWIRANLINVRVNFADYFYETPRDFLNIACKRIADFTELDFSGFDSDVFESLNSIDAYLGESFRRVFYDDFKSRFWRIIRFRGIIATLEKTL